MALDVDRVREIAERVASSSGLEVVDVEFRGGGKAACCGCIWTSLRQEGFRWGVTHEDCANFSREFGTVLDVEDAAPGFVHAGSFVAGAGSEVDAAADFERFTGSRMKLMTRHPVNNNRYFDGRLESFRDGRLTLDLSVASKKSRKKMGAAARHGTED